MYISLRKIRQTIVAIVLERINRAGIPLDSFQLLTAWSWSTDFDLQEKLDDLSAELEGCGFNGIAEDQDLLMKCFTGYILNSTSPSAIMDLRGEQVRDYFLEIQNGLKSSIDFLQKEFDDNNANLDEPETEPARTKDYSVLGDYHVSNYQEQPHVYADNNDTEQPE